ncbi:hypothetical protein B0H11DRAFT_1941443 [Mycena galericulata]|nr:hypothetical protein B0H11DRAFT_1941443 [Mycena galericulata]
MHAIADTLNPLSFNAAMVPFLAKFQEVMDNHHPGLMNVCPMPISWIDRPAQDRTTRDFPHLEFDGMYTLSHWVNRDAARGRRFSLAVMTTPTVGISGEEYTDQAFHMWVLMTAHAPPRAKGKTLVMYDTDVLPSQRKPLGWHLAQWSSATCARSVKSSTAAVTRECGRISLYRTGSHTSTSASTHHAMAPGFGGNGLDGVAREEYVGFVGRLYRDQFVARAFFPLVLCLHCVANVLHQIISS